MSKYPPNQDYLIQEYKSRINRVIDYIDQNVGKELALEELAGIAHFSKFHFHRIFTSFTGETLFRFIARLRVEKAAFLLASHPGKSITEIALDCGFSSSASFARSFKEYFHESATAFRKKKQHGQSNMGKVESNQGQGISNQGKEKPVSFMYVDYRKNNELWRIQMGKESKTVQVKDFPEMTVAYVRYIGPYKGDAQLFARLSGQLFTWAGPRNLINFPETKYLVVYHDDPEITDESKLRVSVCITVPEDTEVNGGIGKMTVAAGKYAAARFELTSEEYGDAWAWVYSTWLPQSGYAPDDKPAFELYPYEENKQFFSGEHGKGDEEPKVTVDICVPVKPM